MKNIDKLLFLAAFLCIIKLAFAEDIIKKTDVIRGAEEEESVYYLGNQEIAKEKILKDGSIEKSGKIPDGRVKFIDQYKDTYGEEYYKNGKKHGVAKTYYKSGKLMKELYYEYGNLIKMKEYYENGNLRIEADYQDSRRDFSKNSKNKEKGSGKLYYSNGVLRYEWNLTKSVPQGYKRAYNQEGALISDVSVDQFGDVIKK